MLYPFPGHAGHVEAAWSTHSPLFAKPLRGFAHNGSWVQVKSSKVELKFANPTLPVSRLFSAGKPRVDIKWWSIWWYLESLDFDDWWIRFCCLKSKNGCISGSSHARAILRPVLGFRFLRSWTSKFWIWGFKIEKAARKLFGQSFYLIIFNKI